MKLLGFIRYFLILGILFLNFFISGCKQNQSNLTPLPTQIDDSIRMGEVQTLTGPESEIGQAIHQGIELGVQELNAKGGILGKKIELITLDDQGRSEEAATAAIKLITHYHVKALLGASASSRSIVMAGVAQNSSIPMITPTSTHPRITELGNYIFRVCFIDPYQGQVMADFAVHQLHFKKVAILLDVKSDYSVGLSKFFEEKIKKLGGEVIISQSYASGDVDFKSQLTAIRAKNPAAIFIPGYYSDVALIARQAKELGITATLLGGDGWSSSKLVEIAGNSIENSYYSSHFSSEDALEIVQKFVTQFKSKYQTLPNGLAALGYDAVQIMAHSMVNAKSLNSSDVRESLEKIRNYPGVTGKISFDAYRNASKSAVILKVDHGQFRFFTRME